MATVISNYTHTFRDINGQRHVQGWLLLEFRAASYQPNGEAVDLTPYFRHAVGGVFGPLSGAIQDKIFEWNDADLSGSLGLVSARVKIWRAAGSGAVPGEVLSGTAVSGARALAYVTGY